MKREERVVPVLRGQCLRTPSDLPDPPHLRCRVGNPSHEAITRMIHAFIMTRESPRWKHVVSVVSQADVRCVNPACEYEHTFMCLLWKKTAKSTGKIHEQGV